MSVIPFCRTAVCCRPPDGPPVGFKGVYLMAEGARGVYTASGVKQRLAAHGLLGGEQDAELGDIAAEAVRRTGAPVALIGFFDGEREVVKAGRGWQVASLPGSYSLAAAVMESGATRLISDAAADPELARHP